MIKNFHLAGIINEKGESKLQRISLRGSTQVVLTRRWGEQYKTFITQEEKDFETSYTLAGGECFRICHYTLRDPLAGKNSENIEEAEVAVINNIPASSIKGLVAFARDDKDNELMLFQNFSRGQILEPGSILHPEGNSHKIIRDKTLRLNNKLTAVYSSEDGKLLFDSFHYAKTFLELSDYYYEASDGDIRALLNHNLFICEDEKKILKNANQYMRRRFAILKDSDILERLSAEYVQEKVAEHKLPIPIQVRCGKLVFPTENNDAKVVLQFLNEEIYQGALTGEYYETNSKRIYRRPKKIVR